VIRAATPAEPLRVAVLVSGQGTNLQALLDRLTDDSPARVVAVASSRADAPALERAARHGVETAVFPRGDDRAARDAALLTWLVERGTELVVLAGFMELLGADFVERLPTINVHPSLLPAFPGLDGIGDALRYGVRITGVTVHLVDAGLDTGPVVMQDAVRVHYDDNAESLHERLRPVEHRLLVEAVLALATDRVRVKGRSVAISSVEGA
jgi:phosphoribosylglycinamide formyltransferase-1